MLKKNAGLFVSSALILSLLGACSTDKTDSQGKDANSPLPSEPVELVFYSLSGDSEENFNGKYGNEIKQKFPNYTIKFIQSKTGSLIPDLLAANQRIDVLYNVFDYALEPLLNYELQFDLTELAKKHKLDLTKFEPSLIEGIKKAGNGKLYMIPTSNQVQMLYYNKGVFDKFGVAYPKDGMTWDDMLVIAQKLTRKDGNQQYFGFVGSPSFTFKTNPYSEPYIDAKTEKATFESEVWKKIIQTVYMAPANDSGYKDWVKTNKRLPNRLNFTNDATVAMFQFHSEFPVAVPKDMEKIDWDMVALPTFKDKPGLGSQASASAMAITSMAKNKDAAMEILKFLTSVENQTAFSKKGMIPVITDESAKKVFAQDSPFKGKNWQSVFYNKLAPISNKSVYELKVENIYVAAIPDIVNGIKDLNTALREAAEKANKAIDDEKATRRK